MISDLGDFDKNSRKEPTSTIFAKYKIFEHTKIMWDPQMCESTPNILIIIII